MSAPAYVFPAGFAWGMATAAYQIEGGYADDGKGESIWDRFSHTPGKIAGGDTGDLACDHYHRWPEDIGLLASLGCRAYRFSLSWPRILPRGYGKTNPAGLDFYSRLVDGLLARGITPYVTLYHWDLPQALQDAGGWPARVTAQAFADFAEVAARRLGDRVQHWMTLNEPAVAARSGYFHGDHAPGHHDLGEAVAAAHHLLLGHGWAVPVLRRDSPACRVGLALNLSPKVPASDSEADQEAARLSDGINNRWYLDPLAGRGYPEDAARVQGVPLAFVQQGDDQAMAAALDFLGVNYYSRNIIRGKALPGRRNRPREVRPLPEITEMGWEVYPDGLYDLLVRLHRDYPAAFPAYYITENGAAYADAIGPGGQVADPQRIAYLAGHLDAAGRAIRAGVPLAGYFVWSFLDNFEWALGYGKRFGLVYVDYATQQRIPKASAHWYSRVMAENALVG